MQPNKFETKLFPKIEKKDQEKIDLQKIEFDMSIEEKAKNLMKQAKLLNKQGKIEEAIENIMKAAHLGNPEAMYNFASILQKEGKI